MHSHHHHAQQQSQYQQSQQPQPTVPQSNSSRGEQMQVASGPGQVQARVGAQSVGEEPAVARRPKRVNSIQAQMDRETPHQQHHQLQPTGNEHNQQTPGRQDGLASSVEHNLPFNDVVPRAHDDGRGQNEHIEGGSVRYGSPGVINLADGFDGSYQNQYSINASVAKSNPHLHHNRAPRFKVGLPLSNSEMHLNPVVMNSPTVSRYSAAAMPQQPHQFPQHHQIATGGLPALYTQFQSVGGSGAIPAMSQQITPLLPTSSYYHHGRASGAVGGGPHAQHHAMHSHHMPVYEAQVAPGTLLQPHGLYERDNVGQEMLNLSQSQHSHTPTSFKMTSPFYEGKQTGAGAPTREVGYSRYDLKLEGDQNRGKNQAQNSQQPPAMGLGQNSPQEDVAVQDAPVRQRREQKNNNGVQIVRENQTGDPAPGDTDAVVFDTPSPTKHRSNFQQQNQSRNNGVERQQRFKEQSPQKEEQLEDTERNIRRRSTGEPVINDSDRALPAINDQRSQGRKVSYQQQRGNGDLTIGTPPTTKQGTTTHREETNTVGGLLQSGEKTSRMLGTSSDDRQNSDALRANSRKDNQTNMRTDPNQQIKQNQMAGGKQSKRQVEPPSINNSSQFAQEKPLPPDHQNEQSRRMNRHRAQQAVKKRAESSSYEGEEEYRDQQNHALHAYQAHHPHAQGRNHHRRQQSSNYIEPGRPMALSRDSRRMQNQGRIQHQRQQAISSQQSVNQQAQVKKKSMHPESSIEQSISSVNPTTPGAHAGHPGQSPQHLGRQGGYHHAAGPPHAPHPHFYHDMYHYGPPQHPGMLAPLDAAHHPHHAAAMAAHHGHHAPSHYPPQQIPMTPHFYRPQGPPPMMDQHHGAVQPLYHPHQHYAAAAGAPQMHPHMHHPHHQVAPMHHPYPHDMPPQYGYHHRPPAPPQSNGGASIPYPAHSRNERAGAVDETGHHRGSGSKPASNSPWRNPGVDEHAAMQHMAAGPPTGYHLPMYPGAPSAYPGPPVHPGAYPAPPQHMMMAHPMHPHHPGSFMQPPPQHVYGHPTPMGMPPGHPINGCNNPYCQGCEAGNMVGHQQQIQQQQNQDSLSSSKVDEKSELTHRSSPSNEQQESNLTKRSGAHQPQHHKRIAAPPGGGHDSGAIDGVANRRSLTTERRPLQHSQQEQHAARRPHSQAQQQERGPGGLRHTSDTKQNTHNS